MEAKKRLSEQLSILLLDLKFIASRTARNKCLLFKSCHLWYFVMASLAPKTPSHYHLSHTHRKKFYTEEG